MRRLGLKPFRGRVLTVGQIRALKRDGLLSAKGKRAANMALRRRR